MTTQNGSARLLVDIGNQRLKWRYLSAARCRAGVVTYGVAQWPQQLDAQFAALVPAAVWVSCVADGAVARAFGEYCGQRWGLVPHFLAAEASCCGVRNAYRPPQGLGVDRWLAMLGARGRVACGPGAVHTSGLIVVDAGTAVTVDLLDRTGQFLGGVIFPGIASMQRALLRDTQQLPRRLRRAAAEMAVETAPDAAVSSVSVSARISDSMRIKSPLSATADNTQQGVAAGALCATVGGINLAVATQLKQVAAQAQVVVSGGDAAVCQRFMAAPARRFDNLVLDGIDNVVAELNRAGKSGGGGQ